MSWVVPDASGWHVDAMLCRLHCPHALGCDWAWAHVRCAALMAAVARAYVLFYKGCLIALLGWCVWYPGLCAGFSTTVREPV